MDIKLNHELPNQVCYKSKRYWSVTCQCGRTWECRLDHAKRPNMTCGCKGRGNLKHGYNKKGSELSLLRHQWHNMFTRARTRDNCEVVGTWLNFESFKKDAIEAGWTEDNRLWVCRKKDRGNYERDNVYFGNRSTNNYDTWNHGGKSCKQ